jgi:hypothetical protein
MTKRKFKDGKYNFHIKKIKESAADVAMDNIDLRGFRKRLERLYTAKGILIGGLIIGLVWIMSLI